MDITINLPDSVAQRLRTVAELTEQPLSELVLQSIANNLPPNVNNAPSEMRAELLKMQALGIDDLRKVAKAQMSPEQQN